jgi:hypothetical protein
LIVDLNPDLNSDPWPFWLKTYLLAVA